MHYLLKTILSLLIFIFLSKIHASPQVQIRETDLDTATIIYGLDIPWEIQWGPDDHIWTTERFGRVSRIHPETGNQDVILDISDLVFQGGESGLLGLVLHPDFENEPYVYMAYTYRPSGQILEKIVRYEYDGEELTDEFVLIDNILGNTTHDGCRMIILPDNTLLFTTGDAQNQQAPQNINHLSGKTLRINLDGSIPDDNPFGDSPVYSFGHRNAQGLFRAPNGIIYSSEHGPNTDDELNIIEEGRNYGWPIVNGFCDLPSEREFCANNNVVEPLVAWTPTVAASDIVYYDHDAIPEWQDHILMTTLKNKRLYALELDEDGNSVLSEEQYFTNWWGRLRDICVGPNGEIYLATNGPNWNNSEPFTHRIVKIWNPEHVSANEYFKIKNPLIRLLPNPAKESLKILVEKELSGGKLTIYSSEGIQVYFEMLDGYNSVIPLTRLSAGLYFLTVEKRGQIHTEKLIVY
jgi:glucose/arabinose dehydrogenase